MELAVDLYFGGTTDRHSYRHSLDECGEVVEFAEHNQRSDNHILRVVCRLESGFELVNRSSLNTILLHHFLGLSIVCIRP